MPFSGIPRITMYKHVLLIVFLVAGLSQTGCSRFARRPPKSYTTIVADSNRDPEKARDACQEAAAFFDKGDLVKAEVALQDALIADVSYAPAHNNLGRIYFDQGKLYLAAWEFEYARRLLPNSGEVANNLGMVYEASEQPDRAIEYYTIALGLNEGNPEFTGNLARALIRAEQDPEQVAALLQDLMFNDSRPEWSGWARDQLNLNGSVRAAAHVRTLHSTSPLEQTEEVQPLPIPYRTGDLATPVAPQDLELPEQ